MSEKPLGQPEGPVPPVVVNRLSLYLREVQRLLREGQPTTSSSQLGSRLGFTDAQVRKDLAFFGQFGQPGVGYRCEDLALAIRHILGTHQPWPVALVGVGNLGRALAGYHGFHNQGFHIAAAFEVDPEKIGLPLEGLLVQHIDELSRIVQERGIRLALLAVPAASAQEVCDRIVAAGVAGILNFAPVTLNAPAHVSVVGVDLAKELEQLTFQVINRERLNEPTD